MLSATILPVMSGPRIADGPGYDRLIYVAMNYWQLSRMMERTVSLRRRSGSTQAYVFDSFHGYLERWVTRFPSGLWPAVRLLRHELRNLKALSRIYVPTELLIDRQQAFLGVAHTYLPLGVDAVKFGSERQDRTIDVNAYGRQPVAITNLLSDTLNVRDGRYRFSHTDHLATLTIRDPDRYRALFWRLLTDSRVALAFAPEAIGESDRFDCAFVAQRWYEAPAAGCVVVGRRPMTPEADRLFDWPDALIEVSGDPEETQRAVLDLIAEPERLATISRRNHRATLAQHDWRLRTAMLASAEAIEPDDRFRAELARASPAHACDQ